MGARYSIGIDLGTSNCALAWTTLSESDGIKSQGLNKPPGRNESEKELSNNLSSEVAHILPIKQRVSVNTESLLFLLPSFLYLSDNDLIVGEYAKEQLAENPERVIHSAKSWLSHSRVDPRAAILPWRSSKVTEANRLSPVDVSAKYLSFVRQAWDDSSLGGINAPFVEQEITISVPASFDEVAQALTLEAAERAGYPSSTRLIEEPQAAFYRSLAKQSVLPFPKGATLLVIDIGGGTTDFSILQRGNSDGDSEWHRVAVSDHLLLGGDNLDRAIAYELERKAQKKLTPAEFSRLIASARVIKESFLNDKRVATDKRPSIYTASIIDRGADMFAGACSVQISQDELEQLLLEGFFPLCAQECKPNNIRGVQTLKDEGLPYATDPRITVHLAAFLSSTRLKKVDGVLMTGGTLKGVALATRLQEIITSWQPEHKVIVLENTEMDFAVALGAADYGKLRRVAGGQISSGYPHSLFLEVLRGKRPAFICLVPQGASQGFETTLSDFPLVALVNVPVRLQLFSLRENDLSNGQGLSFATESGAILSDEYINQLVPLAPLQTSLRGLSTSKDKVKIVLSVRLEDTGILVLHCLAQDNRLAQDNSLAQDNRVADEEQPLAWRLCYNLTPSNCEIQRGVLKEGERASNSSLTSANQFILGFYGPPKKGEQVTGKPSPKLIFEQLERIFKKTRLDWDVPTLRGLWQGLAAGINKRRRSAEHERTFFNLAGFVLRPGFGDEHDPLRMAELTTLLRDGLAFRNVAANFDQWCIFWRRVAGGLLREQQIEIFEGTKAHIHRNAEALRLFGSLERLPESIKVSVGDDLVNTLIEQGQVISSVVRGGVLERLMSRVLMYGDKSCILDYVHLQRWFELLEPFDWREKFFSSLIAAFASGVRIVNDRFMDVPDDLRRKVRKKLVSVGCPIEILRGIDEFVPVLREESFARSGDELPLGFRLN